MRSEHKDPEGGLTPAGRRYFKKKEGANLKPPVKDLSLIHISEPTRRS